MFYSRPVPWTESVHQFPDTRWGEPVFAVRYRTEAFPVEALGDLFGCLTSRDRGLDQAPHRGPDDSFNNRAWHAWCFGAP